MPNIIYEIIICEYFNVSLSFDESKPNGDMKRLMDMNRTKSYGFEPKVSFEEGIKRTIEWYKENIKIFE